MTDYLGNPLAVGDKILYARHVGRGSAELRPAEIYRIEKDTLFIKIFRAICGVRGWTKTAISPTRRVVSITPEQYLRLIGEHGGAPSA